MFSETKTLAGCECGIRSMQLWNKSRFKKVNTAATSDFAQNANLASFKQDFDELDIDQLKSAPVNLIKLSNVYLLHYYYYSVIKKCKR